MEGVEERTGDKVRGPDWGMEEPVGGLFSLFGYRS